MALWPRHTDTEPASAHPFAQTLPAIEALEGRGVVRKVDASRGLDDVFDAACKVYEQLGV